MMEFLGSVFSAALKTNDALEKGVLTGCLRIAKEPIFTGLNNSDVYSVFSKQSSSDFGSTPEEVMCLLNDYELGKSERTVKEWQVLPVRGAIVIDMVIGIFTLLVDRAQSLEYINVCKKIIQKDDEPESFWASTSGNDVIYRFIRQGNAEMKQDFDILSSSGTIEETVKPELTYRELDDTDNLCSSLLFAGCLKAISKTGTNTHQLMVPNKEIQYIYTTIFEGWFKQQIRSYQASFLEALLQERVEEANKILNTVLFQSMSYFDYDEKYYHGLLNDTLQGKGSYRIVSSQESDFGRCDLAILPAYNRNRGLLFELKVAKREEDVEKSAELAIQQIKEEQYIKGLHGKDYTDILGYGIASYKETYVVKKMGQKAVKHKTAGCPEEAITDEKENSKIPYVKFEFSSLL